MDTNIRTEIRNLTEQLIAVPYCCEELKEAGKNWLEAAGKEAEAKASEIFVQVLEESVETIDDVIGFFSSEAAKAHFGEEEAAKLLAHALKRKEEGEQYCDCEACSTALKILGYRDSLLD